MTVARVGPASGQATVGYGLFFAPRRERPRPEPRTIPLHRRYSGITSAGSGQAHACSDTTPLRREHRPVGYRSDQRPWEWAWVAYSTARPLTSWFAANMILWTMLILCTVMVSSTVTLPVLLKYETVQRNGCAARMLDKNSSSRGFLGYSNHCTCHLVAIRGSINPGCWKHLGMCVMI
ncbi:hypothetical protein F5884DRAFT_766364 [Xylogone sp. PMI_703]|nr:hypothetical protein F5884DRAFT_766364 [Xylogone sp. PMI_703]